MNSYIQYFASTLTGRYDVQTECSAEGTTVLCHDLQGNLVATRVFNQKQLQNGPLVSLVLTDLNALLLDRDRQDASSSVSG